MPRVIDSYNDLIFNGFPEKQNCTGIKSMAFFDRHLPSIFD